MSHEVLDEREFELINIIGAKLGSNQRDLSYHMNLSLGQTNMLIRRLVAKGYIRITQLNKRKVSYLLTPKGISEKMRKSIKYTLNTINSIGLIKRSVGQIVAKLYQEGERDFIILGKSDFAILIEMVFKESGYQDCRIAYVDAIEKPVTGTVLICKENVEGNGYKCVDLIREVAKEQTQINLKEPRT